MSPENIITLVASGLAFLASVIAVIVSAYNARFRRFALEKWWERKAQAYAEVVGSFVSLNYSLDRWQDDEIKVMSDGQNTVSEDVKNEIIAEYNKALARIERAATEGNFFLSEKAADTLSDFLKRLRENSDREYTGWTWYETLNDNVKAAKECLIILREEAKKDLQVK